MGQSLSRRRLAATPVPVSLGPGPEHPNDTHSPRRSLPSRILSSIPKPSLRSRTLSSLALPTRPEQTLRGKNRRWRLSRRRNVAATTDGAVPGHMDPLTEHDEHQVDRDVDEFGVITHRVPDNHSDSPAASAKGKEKAEDVPRSPDDSEHDDGSPVPSTSSAPLLAQSGSVRLPVVDDQVVIAPTIPPPPPPRQLPPLPPVQRLERPPVLLPSAPMLPSPSPPQPSSQPTNSPRPFPPPGTLVVVQGVVHTTDVPRSSDRPVTTSDPNPPTTNDAVHSSTNASNLNSTRPSSVPPEFRPRNPLSGILPRPTSMAPAVPSPSEPIIGSPIIDASTRQVLSNIGGVAEDSEDEDRMHTHPHGISMAQGPVGASGLSASSIDVLGTLLSVAAAATAASLLTGSSEPIFSSGLTASQPPPSNNTVSPSASFNSSVPTERPLSPTPTSDAGRMRHVWSSLRDRLGLGGGANNSNHANDTPSGFGLGQNIPSQPADVLRPRDPREIMLAEMARAFNLGLGLGGSTAGNPSATAPANPNTTDLAMPDADVLSGDRADDQSSLPPPDSFERFLMDLQSDLRATLMQEQDAGVTGGTAPDAEENVEDVAEDVEEDLPIPELQSLSDSDSEEFDTRHFESDEEDELEDVIDNEVDDEDVHTAPEQLSGRTSPAVSALGTGTCYPSGVRTASGSPSFGASGMSLPFTATSQSIPTTVSPGADVAIGASNAALNDSQGGGFRAAHPPTAGKGTHVPIDGPSPSEVGTGSVRDNEGERAVLGVTHSPEPSIGEQRGEVEGCNTISSPIAVQQLDAQDPSNGLETTTGRDSSLLGTSSSSVPLTSNVPSSILGNSALPSQLPPRPTTSTFSSYSAPEPSTDTSAFASPNPGDPPMPFRFPFTPNPASRTERTPGGGINWWRMYRFPAITSPNPGQQGPQGSSPPSQPTSRIPTQVPSHTSTSPWARTTDQNEMMAPRGVAHAPGAHTGLGQSAVSPPATTHIMPEMMSASNQSTIPPLSTTGQDSSSPTNATTNPSEHRSNVVVPVIVVGLQSVNMDRQPPHIPQPPANHTAAMDDEDGEGMEFDSLEHPMSLPLQIPEPAEFRRPPHPSNTISPEPIQQPARGRTWQSRAANAFRNLRPSRRNADTASPQPQEAPGSRTFLIYVIGGYYPPDHQIITGGNLDSFEALWELAELLGQVKPPTVSKDEIEKSGLEIIKASTVEEYEKQGRVASNCIDRCLICLDDYNPDDDLRVLACKHTFHQGCVDRWLETGRNNCPACRSKGVSNENVGSTSATPA